MLEILLSKIKSLPFEMISYEGYEALIGLLKWALPLDVDKTLSVAI